jgi:hypothetical protein
MGKTDLMQNLEKLNTELLQAQLLLQASHQLYEDILVDVTRRRLKATDSEDAPLSDELSARLAKFAQRDEEIRRMLMRLQKLG